MLRKKETEDLTGDLRGVEEEETEGEELEGQKLELLRQLEELDRGAPPTEELLALGRTHYMLKDNDLREIIYQKFPHFIPVYIATSHLIRTSNLDFHDVEVLKWRIKEMIDMVLATRRDLTVDDLVVANSLYVHAIVALKDSIDGWRGKLVTEQVKVHRVVEGEVEKDRKRWWERVFGR